MSAPAPVPLSIVTQEHISAGTPMGANLIANGATFRVWAPGAEKVYLIGEFNHWMPDERWLLQGGGRTHWTGFLPGVEDGTYYKLWVTGKGSAGPKRDPYARELGESGRTQACILRARQHVSLAGLDAGGAPAFNDLIIYQFHVGTFYGPNRETPGRQVPGRGRSHRVPGRPGRQRHRAAAHRRIQHAAQHGLQRLRPVLAGDGLSRCRTRSSTLPAARQPPADPEGEGAR